MTPEEARRDALRRFGNPTLTKERVTAIDADLALDAVWRDIHYATRRLLRSPGFAVACVLSLALGIGANAIVFSVVNAIVLRPLPVEHADSVVFLETNSGITQSFPNYRDVRDRNTTLASLAAYRIVPMEVESSSSATRIWGLLATGNYFDLLGIRPALGRFFNAAEDVQPGASPYAVLSYNAWRSRFGGDPGIIGKTIRINRLPYTVLGVAPRDFHGTELWYWPDVWVPMMMEPQIENYPGNGWLDNRSTWDTWVIGRLKQGTSRAQALANLNTIAAGLAREHPKNNEGLQFRLSKPGLAGDYFAGPAKAFALGVLGLAALCSWRLALHKPSEPAHGARSRPTARNRDPAFDWREPCPRCAADDHGDFGPVTRGRSGWIYARSYSVSGPQPLEGTDGFPGAL